MAAATGSSLDPRRRAMQGQAPLICIGEASLVRFGAPARERGCRSGWRRGGSQARTAAGRFPSSDGGGRRVSTPTLAPPRSGGDGGESPLIRWWWTRTRWPWRCCAARSPLPRPPLWPWRCCATRSPLPCPPLGPHRGCATGWACGGNQLPPRMRDGVGVLLEDGLF
jgi:hypothetical protein